MNGFAVSLGGLCDHIRRTVIQDTQKMIDVQSLVDYLNLNFVRNVLGMSCRKSLIEILYRWDIFSLILYLPNLLETETNGSF